MDGRTFGTVLAALLCASLLAGCAADTPTPTPPTATPLPTPTPTEVPGDGVQAPLKVGTFAFLVTGMSQVESIEEQDWSGLDTGSIAITELTPAPGYRYLEIAATTSGATDTASPLGVDVKLASASGESIEPKQVHGVGDDPMDVFWTFEVPDDLVPARLVFPGNAAIDLSSFVEGYASSTPAS